MKNQYAVTITGSGKIVSVINGKSYTVCPDHKSYQQVLNAIKAKDWDTFLQLVDVTTPIKSYLQDNGHGKVDIKDGMVTYDSQPLHNTITNRIITFMQNGLPFLPLVKFLDNLMQNPSKTAVDELYDFLEYGELPITEDGCFLAFKNVREDFKDIRSGTFDNSVGKTCTMPRNQVDDNRDRTCSSGLHFCSIKYLPHYSDANGKTVIVKVNPKNLVSVPSDYNNTKARACEYEVVAEYTEDWRNSVKEGNSGFDSPLYSSKDGAVYGVKPSGQKFYNNRGTNGKFAKLS